MQVFGQVPDNATNRRRSRRLYRHDHGHGYVLILRDSRGGFKPPLESRLSSIFRGFDAQDSSNDADLWCGVGRRRRLATTTTTFAVTETVQATCSATATTLVSAYTPGAGAIANNSTVSVKCTKNTPYTISLNGGTTAGGTIAQRLMASGANKLQYNLFTTAAFSQTFGDGSGTSKTVAGTGAGVATANAVTVFGQLPDSAANQAAVPGSYTDTITVTVTS